ncbi:hypothetical protein [Phaeobacter sp. J2-8]|uniref:hypothetical protein n=1 Tax=Phaeobacter sp. J2-8 TaxID=2931394 RepID=UPI001FD241F6|nr:hypothetical protein [Phaeobacter sp. J2-8]MCJ7872242.1 hypothetical protein [Phaeobacter sp. J2-8]
MRIRFDTGPQHETAKGSVVFDRPSEVIVAHTASDVPAALAAMTAAQAAGRWLAGFASYELGYALEPRLAALMPENRRMPLLMFGCFDGPTPAPDLHCTAARIWGCSTRTGIWRAIERPLTGCMILSRLAISIRPI